MKNSYVGIGALSGFVLGMGSCVFHVGPRLSIIGLTVFGALVGFTVGYIQNRNQK